MSSGFNSKHMTCANRGITLGSMLVSGHGAGSSRRMYHWHTKNARGKEFESMFGIRRGRWEPTHPNNHTYPYYSAQMYTKCILLGGCHNGLAESEFY